MRGDFRQIETVIENFFARRGRQAVRAGGNLFVGARPVVARQAGNADTMKTILEVDDESATEIVSLTELAEELAEALR